jgi:putative phosphoribosyl transferase
LNKQALKIIRAEKKLEVVPGATHLFEEPGKLLEAAKLAIDWFEKTSRIKKTEKRKGDNF